MLKFWRFNHPNQPYREALHTLLCNYPNGLSALEIAEKLGISNSECNRLLKSEQIRDDIDADPSTGILIFKTKVTIPPINTLNKALIIAKQSKFLLKAKLALILLSASIVCFSIIANNLNIFISFLKPNKAEIESELSKQNKIEIRNEIDDLNQRIRNIRSVAEISKCRIYWDNSQTCYIEGRLLTQSEFEKEIDEMKLQISQLRLNNNQ
ncbi:hypothetical protein [Nostoc sp. CCY 9925]|uniref:hypothetical protein n=1 Tax=Nostoc sp. CCY 9925 TaxID=3103865 RepID=UPI0039C6A98C